MNEGKTIYTQEELGGLTQEQLDNMSNKELKEYQRKQSDEEIKNFKDKLRNSIVSAVFFSLLAINLFFNPFIMEFSYVLPIVVTLALSLRVFIINSKLEVARVSRIALELFFKDIED